MSFDVAFPHFKAKVGPFLEVLDTTGDKYRKMFVGGRGGRAVAKKEVLDALIKRSKNEA